MPLKPHSTNHRARFVGRGVLAMALAFAIAAGAAGVLAQGPEKETKKPLVKSATGVFRKAHAAPEGTCRQYKFVQLNGCNTGRGSWLSSWQSEFNAQSILGWRTYVKAPHMRAFDFYFYKYLESTEFSA